MTTEIKHYQTGNGKWAVGINGFFPFETSKEANDFAVKLKKMIQKVHDIKIKSGSVVFE